ncbi:hypothetical protein [Nostoc sp. CALU 1950]|uniref:hypothetical protein n=1 Tax=Nostoc sp. CALU 1950 TaxID=3104321 RepID=UPI003EB7209F
MTIVSDRPELALINSLKLAKKQQNIVQSSCGTFISPSAFRESTRSGEATRLESIWRDCGK